MLSKNKNSKESITNIWNIFRTIIENGVSVIWDILSCVVSAIKSFQHFSVPDKGLLVDTDTYMPDFMNLLTKGIIGNVDSVIRCVKNMVSKVKEQMSALIWAISALTFSMV